MFLLFHAMLVDKPHCDLGDPIPLEVQQQHRRAPNINMSGTEPEPEPQPQPSTSSSTAPQHISPQLALELRLGQLTAQLTGHTSLSPAQRASLAALPPVTQTLSSLTHQFDSIAQASEGVRRFNSTFDASRPLLLQQAAAGTGASETRVGEPQDATTRAILVLEQEEDLVRLDRELREVQVLVDQRKVDQVGQLDQVEHLQKPLDELSEQLKGYNGTLDDVEDQTTRLLGDYHAYVRVSSINAGVR